MRRDMNKVLTERPRAGGEYLRRKKTAKKYRPVDLDDENDVGDGIKRLPSSRKRVYGSGCKHLTDLISPLYNYLESKVGCLWNDVWSEACQTLDRRSTSGNHVFQHLVDYVITVTFMLGGVVHCYVEGSGEPVPVDTEGTRYGPQLYVHPITGVLCRPKRVKKKAAPYKDHNIEDGPTQYQRYTKLSGIWYLSTYRSYPKPPDWFGYFKRRKLDYTELTIQYKENWDERFESKTTGRTFFIPRKWKVEYLVRTEKRQISAHELKTLGLSNDVTPGNLSRRDVRRMS